MTVVFVGVGSNIEPERNVPEAQRRLARRVQVTGVSTFYRTMPLGAPGTPRFVNGVWRIETALGVRFLRSDVLRGIEEELGRRRTSDRNAPRPIDLDVLVYGDAVVEEEGLRLPDPAIWARPFVAYPLWELAPELVLPGDGRRLAEVVAGMSREGLEPLGELTGLLKAEVEHGS
ncbi:MAG: 2-amino-4-hydroxy-6-hydroxymethyldihydropteridine diphosphokinase [Deltaproteobacteria bacterium]|nr:2-amino-4-hydroxy-6-hydroxymethyldihydropteridine diphosphokinase [Deltaproteobacteria bacterium]